MHKLDRASVPVPECLVAPDPGYRYQNLTSREKAEVRNALLAIQHQCCAYCERRTGAGANDGHIEHFRKQADHGHLDLDWSNLFWSCQDENTCGKHKDQCDRPAGSGPQARFDEADLLDPAVDDPERFLLFVSDGTVRPVANLTPERERRATETLRVFQLDASPILRKLRQDAIAPYQGIVGRLLDFDRTLLLKYLGEEIDRVAAAPVPHATAIRHYLSGLSP